jgi:hypothetical protein
VWASDVIVLDTPRGYLIEVSSSSYGLSFFSLKAGSHHDEGAGPHPGGVVIKCKHRGTLARD